MYIGLDIGGSNISAGILMSKRTLLKLQRLNQKAKVMLM